MADHVPSLLGVLSARMTPARQTVEAANPPADRTRLQPVVLIAATARWFATARLALALAQARCIVEVICPPRSPLQKVKAVRRVHTYYGFAPLTSLSDAIFAVRPDLIVAGDDLAAQYLHDLYLRERREGKAGMPICALIERSLGTVTNLPLIYSRRAFLEFAHQEGIRVPQVESIRDTTDLRKCIARIGFPLVLKADGTSSGEGVRIARTLEEAERSYRKLHSPPSLVLALGRVVVNQDLRSISPSIHRQKHTISAQTFVSGRDATSTIACWKGTVLAGLHFEVLHKRDPMGSSTVLRLIENDEMTSAIARLVRRLNLSGIHGFDFVLENGTGDAYLIEMNPRATQTGHLTLGPGRDIPAALYAAISETNVQEAPKLTENDTIALFPQEWIRNPESTYLRTSYHDIPWDEPDLVRACLQKRWTLMTWYSQQKWMETFSAARPPLL